MATHCCAFKQALIVQRTRKSHAKASALKHTFRTNAYTTFEGFETHFGMALIIFLFITSVSAQCLEDDNCEKIEFPHAQDEMRIKRNYSLQGHLLSEHYSFNYYGCFTRCSVNCQCLSFNLKRNSGVGPNCQLNGAASYTDPESVKPKIGWTYIEMIRSYLTKVNFHFYHKETVLRF